ncbi:MAG TPA: hypothetical protein VEU06_05055 [Micropepsaceae bacterium]|nr:hypothetical protein [Micropepsaceae bacterium]
MDERVNDNSGTAIAAGAIEVRVTDVSQLFDTLDPFPFPERDLDRDAEEFIVGWARELPRDHPLKIVVHMPTAEIAKSDPNAIGTAMNRYFTYRSGVIERDLHELFRVGRLSLVIGISVLATALLIAQTLSKVFVSMPLGSFFEQSLIIVAWVANWRPLEIFLYDWWPIVRRRNLYRRLAKTPVELKPY